jgi:GNAT superfamily N-acetyltransferase
VITSAPIPLGPQHEVDAFDCGQPSLDAWLKRRARPNQLSGASRTFVSCQGGGLVVAFYALASGAISVTASTGRFRRNMPEPIPVIILARLAVARSYQGAGLARALVQDAGRRVLHAAEMVGIRGLIVHSLSDDARNFYLHLGFDPSPLDPMTLMVTLTDLRAALGSP